MTLELPKLSPRARFTEADGTPTREFRDWYNQVSDALIAQEALQDSAISDIQRTLRALSYPADAAVGAEADGVTAKATVSAHTRAYLDTTVAVNAGEVTGLTYNTLNFLYYDDPNNAGGAVSYIATTNQADALTSAGNPNRHFVGSVTAPATSGDPPTTGNPSTGAGGVEVQ